MNSPLNSYQLAAFYNHYTSFFKQKATLLVQDDFFAGLGNYYSNRINKPLVNRFVLPNRERH
jgi:hypothetical protein